MTLEVAMNHRRGDGAFALERIKQGKNVSVPALADLIGCSPNHLWKCIRDGEIESVKVGSLVTVPSRVAGPLAGLQPERIAA